MRPVFRLEVEEITPHDTTLGCTNVARKAEIRGMSSEETRESNFPAIGPGAGNRSAKRPLVPESDPLCLGEWWESAVGTSTWGQQKTS